MSTDKATYKYWFWAGAVLFIVSLFLPVYDLELMGSSSSKPLGIQVWYESVTFDGVKHGFTVFLSFVFTAFNLLQVLYLAPKLDGWMIEGLVPKIFLAIAFGVLPCSIAYESYYSMTTSLAHNSLISYTLHGGMYAYLAGYIASGIGIIQLRKHARAEAVIAKVESYELSDDADIFE